MSVTKRGRVATVFLPVTTTTVFCPAKLNLFLAITGRREDGFHTLVSVVAKLDVGDDLSVTIRPGAEGAFTLACNDPEVPVNEQNLVLKAVRAFAAETGRTDGVDFVLQKRIPMGAGLGGGSSDGVGALLGLNALAGQPLAPDALHRLAATLGSDCPLFLGTGVQIMRGRGERLQAAGPGTRERVTGQRVLVFKPPFGVSTAWAYGRLAATAPGSYVPENDAEARLSRWLTSPRAPLEDLCFNTMEPPVFDKYPAIPVLAERLQATFGLRTHMSGSGSACYALLGEQAPVPDIEEAIRRAWGPTAFVTVARIRD